MNMLIKSDISGVKSHSFYTDRERLERTSNTNDVGAYSADAGSGAVRDEGFVVFFYLYIYLYCTLYSNQKILKKT